jgi:Fe2+ or Zn2+ uptake regulation protein
MIPTARKTAAATALREAGLRATSPRIAILSALLDNRSHPTAEHIHANLRDDHPSLSLSTVYSTLETFLTAGLCRRVNSDGSRLRVDGILSDHVFRLPEPPAALPGGLEVRAVRVEYDVMCGDCRTTSTAEGSSPPDMNSRKI